MELFYSIVVEQWPAQTFGSFMNRQSDFRLIMSRDITGATEF
jgi:hypothetical protein